jgi:hypothetical protein
MRVVVPRNVWDCVLLVLVCQEGMVDFLYCDPVEVFDMYKLNDEVVYKKQGELLEEEYVTKGFKCAGLGHPQWHIQI